VNRRDLIPSSRYVESSRQILVLLWVLPKALLSPRHWVSETSLCLTPIVYFLLMTICFIAPTGCSVKLLPKYFIGMIYTIRATFKRSSDSYLSYRSVWPLASLADIRSSVLLIPSVTSIDLLPICLLMLMVILKWFLMYRCKQNNIFPMDCLWRNLALLIYRYLVRYIKFLLWSFGMFF